MKYFLLPFLFFTLYSPTVYTEDTTFHTDKKIETTSFSDKETEMSIPDPFPPEEDIVNTNGNTAPLPSMESLFIKTLFLLVFVITALFSAVWLLKKLQGGIGKKNSQSGEKTIELVERAYLSSKTCVWYARIDNVPFVIVEGQHGVSLTQIQKPAHYKEYSSQTSFPSNT